MKTLLKNLEKQLERVEMLIEKREEQFENKSEKWQESEKGEEFECTTDSLREIQDNLMTSISELEDILGQ